MYIGIDLGGTNIAVGVVDENGKIFAQDSTPTIATREYTEIVADMAKLCESVTKAAGLEMKDIKAIGIGSPGSVDSKNGIVEYANNISMKHTPLAAELKKYFNIPVHVENDANAAAYGEYVANGDKVENFLFVTLGTGVGGGIIINKKIYCGFNGTGGEIGHFTLVHDGEPCTCGNKGCWEAYASVTALIRQTKEAIEKHPDSIMAKMAAEQGKVNGRTAFDSARQGDSYAQEVVDKYIHYVADGISSMINILQPEKLVIGGGISKEGDYLLKPIIRYCGDYGYNRYMPQTDITIATLRNDAGIVGAALAARDA